MSPSRPSVVQVIILAVSAWAPAVPGTAAVERQDLWPEEQRAFLQDGPGLLLPIEERRRLEGLPPDERRRAIEEFLASDPIPATPENELRVGIARRRRLVESTLPTWLDDRARLLFLNGRPEERLEIDCGQTFVPLEIWTYGAGDRARELVVYQRRPGEPYRLWLPLDSKLALYQADMANVLQQLEAFGRYGTRRFDVRTCAETPKVDRATGVISLNRRTERRPTDQEVLAYLQAPTDLARWAEAAARTPLPEPPPALPIEDLAISYPGRDQQRIIASFLATVPAGTPLGRVTEGSREEIRLALDGVVEQDGEFFEQFRVRYKVRPPAEGRALALAFERSLRPDREFLLRYHLVDEISGAEARGAQAFHVPDQPDEKPPIDHSAGLQVERGEFLEVEPVLQEDNLLLAPPDTDVVFGVWRADALVVGSQIERVVFLVDGEAQLTKGERPFSAELRLARFPREQVVRAEGYDADGRLVAVDEVLLNEPRGAFRVRIVEPDGAVRTGRMTVRAEVTAPDERRVESVEFRLNDDRLGSLTRPPWEIEIEVPRGVETSYLTVTAKLDTGEQQEAVRFLNEPEISEELEVRLVELVTTVTDRSGRFVTDLGREDFRVLEDQREQEIHRFEHVEDASLCIGIAIDTSSSMAGSLLEAKRAAVGFLRNIVGPTDKTFAVAFARYPTLLIPPTDDVMAVEHSLDGLQSIGWTALHDSVVTSLYYFRAFKGQRALVLLSDGDDSSSYYSFEDALEYARRSGVVIYTVGLDIGSLKLGVRGKLSQLAEETGGRSFFIGRAAELDSVYREIEQELRSQYLITYASDNTEDDDEFRTVDVSVRDGKLKARTIRGYFP